MCALSDTLNKADAAALAAALTDPTYPTAAITRALNDEGHQFVATTVARHRKGECRG